MENDNRDITEQNDLSAEVLTAQDNGVADELKTESDTEGTDTGKKKKKKSNEFLDWLKVIVIAVAVALILNNFVIINSVVPSGSMIPTINEGDRMIGNRLAYAFGNEPERGDIIIFRFPDDTSQIYVKRVIGIPGDVVEIKGGVTYVNGEVIDEPYLNETPDDNDFGPYTVPEDSYFVMGDNRNNSYDSRYWETTNFVPEENILAKAVFRYWPLNNISTLK